MKRPLAVFCLTFLLTAGLRLWLNPPDSFDYAGQDGRECRVQGQVYKIEQSVLFLNHLIFYETNHESFQEEISHEGIMCYMESEEEMPPVGSTVLVSGRFETFEEASNPGEFDARMYYKILHVAGRLKNAALLQKSKEFDVWKNTWYQFKLYCEKKLKRYYPEKEAGILMTMLLGDKAELDTEVKELYREAGILHILSVSGLHISVLGYGVYKLLCRLRVPVRLGILLSIAWMWTYGTMIGMGVSVFRAVLMFSLRMAATWCKRTYDLLTALAVAAALLIWEQPLYFYHSGFWLSFLCVLAIQLVYPYLKLPTKQAEEMRTGEMQTGKRMTRENSKLQAITGLAIYRSALNSCMVSVSVTLVTLPVFLWFYYEVSLWGILWNLLVVPLMGLVLSSGIVNLLLPQALEGVSQLVARGNCLLLNVFEGVCRITQGTGAGTVILGQPRFWQILLFSGGMILFVLTAKKLKYYQRWLVLSLLTVLLLFRVPRQFTITFLDVGQGDGICVQNGDGQVYLIDGGSSSKKSVGTHQLQPFLKQQGIRSIDAVFLSHADSDHINGICELLKEQKGGIKIQSVVLGGQADEILREEYEELLQCCREENTRVYAMREGEVYRDGKLSFVCLNPSADFVGDTNESSMVLYLTYGEFSALFTGDVEGIGEQQTIKLLQEYHLMPVTLLKVAHHGSRNSTSEDFLAATRPRIAVISAGQNNSYGHPHEETLERLKDCGTQIYQTKDSGAVTVRVKGAHVTIEEFRP